MNLKIQQRESQDNLFVRLHPTTVRQLCKTCSASAARNLSGKVNDTNSWTIQDEVPNDVQFLPLRIKKSDGNWVYCSYNGGFCEKEDTINVARITRASVNSFANVVTLEALPAVRNASSIQIEPLTIEGWELLEVFAQQLEEGALLKQVSIVSPRQEFSLKLGNDLVGIRVLEDGFCHDGKAETCKDSCLRLVDDTEVVVTPRPRASNGADKDVVYEESGPIRVLPNHADFSPAMKQLYKLFESGSCLDDLLPCPPMFTALMHPDSLSSVQGWDSTCANDPNSTLDSFSPSSAHVEIQKCPRNMVMDSRQSHTAVVEITSSKMIPLGCIVLHSDTRLQLTCSALEDFISVTVLTNSELHRRRQFFASAVESSKIVVTLYPVSAASIMNSEINIWTCPEEVVLDRKRQLINGFTKLTVDQCLMQILNDVCDDDASLSHGSIISIPSDDTRGTTRVQILLKKPNESVTRSRFDTEEIDKSKLLFYPSQLLSEYTTLSEDETSANHIDPLLNSLPPILPSTDYIESVSDFERSLSTFIRSAKSKHSAFTKKNYLVYGAKGSGRTFFSLLLAARLRMSLSCATFYLDCRQLQAAQPTMEGILKELTRITFAASRCTPSILILDGLDELIPNVGNPDGEHEDNYQQRQHSNPMLESQCKLLADHTKFLMGELKNSNVFVIGICIEEGGLNKSLRTVDTFSAKMKVPDLSVSERLNLFRQSVQENGSCPLCHDFDLPLFASQTKDFLPLDLKNAAAKVSLLYRQQLLRRQTMVVDDITVILERFTPLSKQALKLEPTQSHMAWSDIGGLFQAKDTLSSIVLRPIKYRKIFQHAPISLPRGILLFGFPGCGKTCIVPALAQECGFNLVYCRGPELLDKYIGASEANVRLLFERAYAAAPAILFLDEFDALAPRRGSDNTGVTDRVVNQLLTFLDGVEVQGTDSEKMVYIVASSSRPDKIDPALLRPGRLEKHVYIGYADCDKEWNDLLYKISKPRNIEEHLDKMIASGSFQDLLNENQFQYTKLSAADIKGVFDTAHLNAVHELLKEKEQRKTVTITCQNLLQAFLCTKPSLSESDRSMFSRVFTPFLGTKNPEAHVKSSKLRTALK